MNSVVNSVSFCIDVLVLLVTGRGVLTPYRVSFSFLVFARSFVETDIFMITGKSSFNFVDWSNSSRCTLQSYISYSNTGDGSSRKVAVQEIAISFIHYRRTWVLNLEGVSQTRDVWQFSVGRERVSRRTKFSSSFAFLVSSIV